MTPEQIVGWAGTVLISAASIPQTIKVGRQGHADGLTWSYIVLLWFGFICMFLYTPWDRPALKTSYLIQIGLFAFIMWRKENPRR